MSILPQQGAAVAAPAMSILPQQGAAVAAPAMSDHGAAAYPRSASAIAASLWYGTWLKCGSEYIANPRYEPIANPRFWRLITWLMLLLRLLALLLHLLLLLPEVLLIPFTHSTSHSCHHLLCASHQSMHGSQ